MKIRKFRVENFGSYPMLEVDFEEGGLALLHGPTGAGKSTVMDAVCWCLYGVTAKDGNADDVRSWFSQEPTTGSIVVEAKGNEYVINRVRGKPSQNDLEIQGTRGVNVTETQRLIDQKLGADAYTFIAASYFNEFSPTGSFFVARAKDRRDLFVKLANLSFPNTLSDRLTERRIATKKKITGVGEAFIKEKTTVDNLTHTVRSMKNSEQHWEYTHQLELENIETDRARHAEHLKKEIEDLNLRSANFEQTKQAKLAELRAKLDETKFEPDAYFNDRLELLTEQINKHQAEKCTTCGQTVSGHRADLLSELEAVKHAKWKNGVLREKAAGLAEQIASVQNETNHYEDQIARLPQRKNPYDLLLETEKVKVNPYTSKLEAFQNDLTVASVKMVEQESLLNALKDDLNRLNQLYDMCPTLRAELLKMAINAIQEDTNNYLEKYFDSELRIEFTLDGDDLDVGVQKSGNACSYKQLSKGQRQLLKLTFALSVMAASANQSGMKFENLFFDEALDGLDESLKLKAFSLFEALEPSYTSILLIDHAPAFQNMFAKKFFVGIEGDKSYIKEQHE